LAGQVALRRDAGQGINIVSILLKLGQLTPRHYNTLVVSILTKMSASTFNNRKL